jgi:hypothetical protein
MIMTHKTNFSGTSNSLTPLYYYATVHNLTVKVGYCLVHHASAAANLATSTDSFRQAVKEGKVRLVECDCGLSELQHYRVEAQDLMDDGSRPTLETSLSAAPGSATSEAS